MGTYPEGAGWTTSVADAGPTHSTWRSPAYEGAVKLGFTVYLQEVDGSFRFLRAVMVLIGNFQGDILVVN